MEFQLIFLLFLKQLKSQKNKNKNEKIYKNTKISKKSSFPSCTFFELLTIHQNVDSSRTIFVPSLIQPGMPDKGNGWGKWYSQTDYRSFPFPPAAGSDRIPTMMVVAHRHYPIDDAPSGMAKEKEWLPSQSNPIRARVE